MRLLMLTPALPYPLHQGGAIRNYGIIHGLRTAGHNVTLLSFHSGNPPVESTPLIELCAAVETIPAPTRSTAQRLRDFCFSRQPDLTRRLYSDIFERKLEEVLSQTSFDLVQFEGLEMTGYLPAVRRHQPTAKLVYDAHNAEYALQRIFYEVDRENIRRWPAAAYSWVQSRRIERYERSICEQVDGVIAVSDEDAELLCAFRPDRRVAVMPNGIFVDDYNSSTGEEHLDLGEHVLTFTGKMDYRPNVDAMLWFTDAILPQVLKHIPNARLYIVGQKPHRRLEALRDKQRVEITGWVAQVHPFLRATDVYVAPLRMGSGTKLKILEAMAVGCAVVATPTAAAGLPPEVKQATVIAEREADLAEAIVTLLQDPARREALGKMAQAAVQQHYDWSLLFPRLLQAYREIGLG